MTPKPPISESPASRRNSSLAQAVGVNRRTGLLVEVFSEFVIAFFAPFVVIEAAGTDRGATALAAPETVLAETVLATRTTAEPTRAVGLAAVRTIHMAFIAEALATPAAAVQLLLVGEVAAIGARLPMPVFQRDKRAFGVVGPQHARHEREKIQQPSLHQGLANGQPPFAFAEDFIEYVRMGDRTRARRQDGVLRRSRGNTTRR